MNFAILATLVASGVIALFVLRGTWNGLLASLGFVFAPLLSLSFWVIKRLTDIGPSNFIPNWMAGAMIAFPFIILFIWPRITIQESEERKE